MRQPLLLSILLFSLLGLTFAGCGEDSTGPQGDLQLTDLEGSWELVRVISGSISNDLSSGNAYYYFNANGEMCSLWRTAYGTYYNGPTGHVSSNAQQFIEQHEEVEAVYELTCWAEYDSLGMALVSPDTLGHDMYVFHRVYDAPEATCFERK